MKKLLIMVLLAVGTATFADDYKYLTMGYNSVEKSIELSTIKKITFENGQVVVATSDGNQTFVLTEMEKMYFSEEATAIERVSQEKEPADEVVYDLCGRAVTRPAKGIYIVNGKKVLIK